MTDGTMKIVRWGCRFKGCRREHESKRQAQACFDQGFKPTFKVGDIVKTGGGHCWYDGSRKWIINPRVFGRQATQPFQRGSCPNGNGNCFSECCTMVFYYVVTYIDSDRDCYDDTGSHRPRYHLFTKAITGGNKKDAVGGHTFDRDHVCPEKLGRIPKFILKDSKGLIGKKADYLI